MSNHLKYKDPILSNQQAVDGVHPTIDLSRSWFKHMEKVVSKNEKNLVVIDI
jgi:flagellar biosynthesis/type III secretory pathway ATPase